MSTIFQFDLAELLKPGEKLPRVGLAEIVQISGDGDEKLVKQNILVDFKRDRSETVLLNPGSYLVRLRAGSGQFFMRRVRVADEGPESSITFAPSGLSIDQEPTYLREQALVEMVASVPKRLAPYIDDAPDKETSRTQWTAQVVHDSPRLARLDFLPGLELDKVVRAKQDFLGLARLQGGPQIGDALSIHKTQDADLSTLLVGNIQAFQAARLYGDVDDLHASWKKPLRKNSIIGAESQEGNTGRFFALSFRAVDGIDPLQVACVPGRWRKRDGDLAQLSVSYHKRLVRGVQKRSLAVDVDDPEIGGLIDFLQQGDLQGSVKMLDQAVELLYEKWRNPYASAAAGYVLIQTANADITVENWTQWILNLASRFTLLPDGAILFCTLLLQRYPQAREKLSFEEGGAQHFKTARGAALEAVRRGPPLFRYGLKLMSTNLAILEGEIQSPDTELQAAIRYVRKLSLRVDSSQAFSVFDVEA